MRRRQFLGLIGAGATMPFASRAQQSGSPAKIGFLYPGPEAVAKLRSIPLLAGLASEGLREPDQIKLFTRATGGDARQIAPLLNELLASKVDLLMPSGPAVTSTVYATTKSLPIVTFDLESDPVESGWLQSYAHPGGNLTGVFSDFPDFASKWLELLREIVPGLSYLVVLWDPETPMVQPRALSAAAQRLNVRTEVFELRPPSEFDGVFEAISARQPDGVVLLSSPVVSVNSSKLAELTQQHRLPSISLFSSFARSGGLISYGPNLDEIYRETGVMAAKVLKGAKPADLPAERPTRFELFINSKTAKALGLKVSDALLVRADEVIE
ncbi:ABC transporter substrate-binding protein [Bradyrhizobium jicamae]|uniref:ABC transporter substrate-binding protein n=1 Tax=Bradyrhizobium jicamae TaxID=280332 RepID=UPI001BADB536|nr:ABC transporter substrate-binding protein [Bradyrhizobium jicamae]MBR0939542.1 ABC transporter substrate-binding protein [Bradyrhizobium jicamae]